MLGALAYDLKHELREDVRGLLSTPRTISPLDVIWWIRHLPEDSALGKREITGEQRFSTQDRINAQIVNELRMSNYNFQVVNMEEKEARKLPPPEFIEL